MKRLLLLIMAFAMLFPMVSSLGALEVTIGDGDINDRFPFDFWYKNSIYQCLYYPSELEMTSGTISQIKFYNNFSSDTITSKPIKIWLGTTSLESLSSGFVPTSSLTLVYDGTMDFPAGKTPLPLPYRRLLHMWVATSS